MKRPNHTLDELAGRLLEQLAALLDRPQRRPGATYRLQFHGHFRFGDARSLVPYLDRLGITDLYASPFLRASPASNHGYDVFDHNALNPEVGGADELATLVAELASRQMGHILDMVPNHMGIVGGNPFWQHVLEHGAASPYACFFDIDWQPVKDELEGRILLPILGDQFGVVLERGELRLSLEQGAFWVSYWEHRLPVAPRQYPLILEHRRDELARQIPALELEELESIASSLRRLAPAREPLGAEPAKERLRETAVAKRRIDELCRRSPVACRHLEENVAIFNGTPGEPRSFDLLERLLEDQSYRLAYWRVAGEEINYRRFFDLNSLAAIRMEDADVFQQLHRLVFGLIARGQLTGLRVDHPDGLLRPRDYFRRLQEEFVVACCRSVWEGRPLPGVLAADGGREATGVAAEPAPTDAEAGGDPGTDWADLAIRVRQRYQDAHADRPDSPLWRPLYVIAEKILGRGEQLPGSWAVHGTTGYDFANVLNGIFVDRDNGRALADVYGRFLGSPVHYGELVYSSKKLITGSSMVSEINVLAHRLNKISERHRRTRDFTLNSLRSALVELVAVFPVYRTYIDVDGRVDERDRDYIQWAVARAKTRAPALDPSIFDFLADVMLGRDPGGIADTDQTQSERLSFTLKLQQLTGPVMAKGIEDTAFYVYNRLISLNEVGGEPELFGTSVETFHQQNSQRLERAPLSLLCTSTHDTKRGEDVRARINVISEVPAEWKLRLSRWHRWNRRYKVDVNGVLAPDRNEEVQLYQTLIGAWPDLIPDREGCQVFIGRMQEYLVKAVKEAKVNTSWFNSDRSYEDAVSRFVGSILSSLVDEGAAEPRPVDAEEPGSAEPGAEEHEAPGGHPFVADLSTFVRRLQPAGYYNALSQVLLKLVSPGVPDLYQGTELWDRSLVDPDNRRPVDFAGRQALLERLVERAGQGAESQLALWQELCSNMADGRIKLYLIWRLLELRRRRAGLLLDGEYVAPRIEGTRAEHLVAVERRLGEGETGREGGAILALAPRLMTRLLDERARHGPTTSMWQGTRVLLAGEDPATSWRDVLSGLELRLEPAPAGATLRVAELLDRYPVVLLERVAHA